MPLSAPDELLLALKSQMERYNEYDVPAFRDMINEYITRESKKCSIHPSTPAF